MNTNHVQPNLPESRNFEGLADNIEAKRMYYSGAIGIVALVFRVAQSEPSQVPALFVREVAPSLFAGAHA